MGKIIRSISKDGSIRIIFSDSRSIIDKASRLFDMTPTVTAAFGRCLTAASLMGSLLKDNDNSLTLQIKSNGPIEKIVCVSDYKGNVKGYVTDYSVDLPLKPNGKLDVGGAIGDGTLYVIRDLGMKEPYIGMSELVSGEVAEDIANYYVTSEQTPTVCALGVLVGKDGYPESSGGYLAQLMPGADDAIVDILEKNCTDLPPVSRLLASGRTAEEIISMLFEGIEYEIFDTIDTDYICECSMDKYEKAFISLGKAELMDMIHDNKPVKARCSFCNKEYEFTVEKLTALLEKVK